MTDPLPETSLRVYFSHTGNAISGNLEHEYLAMMPPGIRASILRYRRWQDRQATLFGKLLLLRALRTVFRDSGAQALELLQVPKYGKPFIPGGPEFNISHSEEVVVLALTPSGAVGIDIEKIRAVDVEDFSRYLPEVANLPGKHDADRVHNLFFDCWTKKEAVLKGCGKGLLAPLEQVAINGDTAFFNETKWFLRRLPIAKGYCCHVATDKPLAHVAVERVNLSNGVL